MFKIISRNYLGKRKGGNRTLLYEAIPFSTSNHLRLLPLVYRIDLQGIGRLINFFCSFLLVEHRFNFCMAIAHRLEVWTTITQLNSRGNPPKGKSIDQAVPMNQGNIITHQLHRRILSIAPKKLYQLLRIPHPSPPQPIQFEHYF